MKRTAIERGYTLPEVLVVTALTVLAAALLCPMFVRAQQNVQPNASQVCQNNLRLIGLGILMYTQDYDEKLPLLTYPSRKTSWRSLVRPYINGVEPFTCPSNPERSVNAWSESVLAPVGYNSRIKTSFRKISYAANANVISSSKRPISVSQIKMPSQLILVGESLQGNAEMPFNLQVSQFSAGKVLFAGHNGMTNCLFADGHVKPYKPSVTVNMWFSKAPNTRVRKNYLLRLKAAENYYQARRASQ